eukprot:gene28376-34259_t
MLDIMMHREAITGSHVLFTVTPPADIMLELISNAMHEVGVAGSGSGCGRSGSNCVV